MDGSSLTDQIRYGQDGTGKKENLNRYLAIICFARLRFNGIIFTMALTGAELQNKPHFI